MGTFRRRHESQHVQQLPHGVRVHVAGDGGAHGDAADADTTVGDDGDQMVGVVGHARGLTLLPQVEVGNVGGSQKF